jgi:hypothetical protein
MYQSDTSSFRFIKPSSPNLLKPNTLLVSIQLKPNTSIALIRDIWGLFPGYLRVLT